MANAELQGAITSGGPPIGRGSDGSVVIDAQKIRSITGGPVQFPDGGYDASAVDARAYDVFPGALGVAANLDSAIIASVAQSRPLHIVVPGDYLITAPIHVLAGLRWVMHPGVVLVRGYSGTGTTGLITQVSMSIKTNDVRIQGGTIRCDDIDNDHGNQVCLYGDDIHLDDLTIDEWATDGRAFLLAGDRIRMARIRAVSAGEGGGIRYIGGDDFMCSDSYVECGDDCYNFVPGGAGSLLFDHTIRRGQYVNCTGNSLAGRLFLATIIGSGTLDMDGSILDCAFIGIRGKAANRAFVVQNANSVDGKIARIDITDCMIDCTDDVTGGNAAYIFGETGTGGVEDVRCKGLTILSPFKEALEVSGVVTRVVLDGFHFGKPRTAGEVSIDWKNASQGCIKNGYLETNGAAGISVGTSAATVRNLTVENNTIAEIDNGTFGLAFSTAIGWKAGANRFIERSGQTTARGIQIASTSSEGRLEKNDYAGLTGSDPVSYSAGIATQNIMRPMDGVVRNVTGSTTLRAYHSGQCITNAGASSLVTLTAPAATPGLEFSLVVQDTDGIKFLAVTPSVIRLGATVSGAAGFLQSTTIGDACKIRCVAADVWMVTEVVGAGWAVT